MYTHFCLKIDVWSGVVYSGRVVIAHLTLQDTNHISKTICIVDDTQLHSALCGD